MLYLLLFERKEGEMGRGLFPGQTYLGGSAMLGFPWLLGAIKSCFKGQFLNFMCTLLLWWLFSWLKRIKFTQK
jgi:hypothetical protein